MKEEFIEAIRNLEGLSLGCLQVQVANKTKSVKEHFCQEITRAVYRRCLGSVH